MSEIEEIKRRWKDSFIGRSTDPIKVLDPFRDIQTLLSSLEKEKERVKELEGKLFKRP